MRKNRWIGYILINLVVSATTVLVVLVVWEARHPAPTTTPLECPLPAPTQPTEPASSGVPTATLPVLPTPDSVTLSIQSVVGAGDIDLEYVEILNPSESPVNLTNWQLLASNGERFTFPTLILNTDGRIRIFSKAGQNTVLELYWQKERPVWRSGETVQLLNADGLLITNYAIP